jgi:hypothetical protein
VRNKRLAGAALAAALAAGCRRAPAAPVVDAAGGVTLAAPAPSSTVVTSPLGAGASSYTNEMQAQNLRDQAAELGISRLSKPSIASGMDSDAPHRTITYHEVIERTRVMTREAEAERHAIEGDKNKSVAIPTQTPDILPGNKEGSPIEDAPEGPGPKGPATP